MKALKVEFGTQDRQDVQSSAIERVQYNRTCNIGYMLIQFKDGKPYSYVGVPRKIYDQFIQANSKGRFFQDNIVDRYDCFEIEESAFEG